MADEEKSFLFLLLSEIHKKKKSYRVIYGESSEETAGN